MKLDAQQRKPTQSKHYAINQPHAKSWRPAREADVAHAASPLDMRALGWTFIKSVVLSALIVVVVLTMAELWASGDHLPGR